MNKFEEALQKMQLLDENGTLNVKGGFVNLSMETKHIDVASNVNVNVSGNLSTCACKCDGEIIIIR